MTLQSPLGVFTINHIIRSESNGHVLNVRCLRNGEEYAAKPIVLKDESVEKLLSNEINILKKLTHKNLLKLKEVYKDDIQVTIVTEWCLCELSTFTDVFQLNQDLYSFIMGCISSGLEYLHRKMIAHRDIKLDNVLLRKSDYMFVIVDMVSSKMYRANPMKTFVGTPAFIAPEVVKTHKGIYQSYNEIADIWSLGIIGYVMVTDDIPFRDNDNLDDFWDDLLQNSCSISITSKNMCSINLNKDRREFNNRMLNPEPKLRPNAALCTKFFAKCTPETVYKKMNSIVAAIITDIYEKRDVFRSDLSKELQEFNAASMRAARKNIPRVHFADHKPRMVNSSSETSQVFPDHNVYELHVDICRLRDGGKYVGVVGKSETTIVYDDNLLVVFDHNKNMELIRIQLQPIKAVLFLKFNDIEAGLICLRESGELYHLSTERTNNLNGNSFRVSNETRLTYFINLSYPVIGLKYCNGADVLIAYTQKSVYVIKADMMYPNFELLFDTNAELSTSEKIYDCNCTLRRTASGEIYEILVICIDHKNSMKVYQCSLATAMWTKTIRECIVPDNMLNNPIYDALYIQQQNIFPDLPQDDYIFVTIGNQILAYSIETMNPRTISYGNKIGWLKLDPNSHSQILRNLHHGRIILNGYQSEKNISMITRFNHIFDTHRLISTGSHGKILRMMYIDDSSEYGKKTQLLSIERND